MKFSVIWRCNVPPPTVPESLGLVPDLDEILVVLDHNVVLVELPVHVRLCTALNKISQH